jgi:hypothetical protein
MGFAECLGHSASLGILVVICSRSWWWHRSFYYGRAWAKATYGAPGGGAIPFYFFRKCSSSVEALTLGEILKKMSGAMYNTRRLPLCRVFGP